MSRVLVIRGASFATNRLATITFDDNVPCTGISLNSNTISFTEWDETFQLTATLAPSNTTDNVTWSSSDDSVATVSSNGLVTSQNVIGTATITAQCGNYSATCSVSSVVTFSGSDLLRKNDYGVVINASGTDAAKFIGGSYYALVCYGLSNGLISDYEVAVNSSATIGEPMYSIPIPTNATTLKITLPDTTGTIIGSCDVSYHNAKALQTSVSGVAACKYVGHKTYQSTSFGDSGTTLTVNLTSEKPNEADSICLYIKAASSTSASVITDPITVAFS